MDKNIKIEKLKIKDLRSLTELFTYNDVEEMILNCTQDIEKKKIDIFVLYHNDTLIGELRVKYEDDDENYAALGRRAYLYAFRIREGFRNQGYGSYLLKMVLDELAKNGYTEFTVGVEDDNIKAIHMYRKLGFTEFLLRKQEEYQGDAYEYSLYLKKRE